MDNIEDILRALAEDDDSSTPDESSDNNDSGGLFSGMDIGSMAKIAGLLGAAGKSCFWH